MPVVVGGAGDEGAPVSDDVEVIEMTPEEYEAAKARALAELGLTYEDKALISAVGEKYTGSRGALVAPPSVRRPTGSLG